MRQQYLFQLFVGLGTHCFDLGANLAKASPSLLITQVTGLREHAAQLVAKLVASFVGNRSYLVLLFVDKLKFLLNFIAYDQARHPAAAKKPRSAESPRSAWAWRAASIVARLRRLGI